MIIFGSLGDMGPIVKIRRWRAKKAREALAARIRLEIVEIRNERRKYQDFASRCPDGDSLCEYRKSLQHARLAIAHAEKRALERLDAVTNGENHAKAVIRP